MTCTIDTLKQMVKALEWCHGGEPVGTAEAIQAGKKLIAELESQGKTMKVEGPLHVVCQCDKCKTESQEPVGWIDSKGNMLCVKINESCKPLYTHPPQRPRVVFPTMLRKMWSGGEVQAWLDENVNKEKHS